MCNVLIAGGTGVGKSTLINSVFHGRMAATGQGKPVTKAADGRLGRLRRGIGRLRPFRK